MKTAILPPLHHQTHSFVDTESARTSERASATNLRQQAGGCKEQSEPPRVAIQSRSIELGDTATTRPISRGGPPKDSDTLIRILKAHKVTVHGAHIHFVGIPAILALGSAYAAGKITRKVFFDTLNLFVRHADADSFAPIDRRIRPEHLIALGLPKEDAERLPLADSELDIWLVAGLFNGVMDMEDFELLQNPEKKGSFIRRHFGLIANCKDHELQLLKYPFCRWDENKLLLTSTETFRTQGFHDQIQPACARLEKGGRWYTPFIHYMLRLAAAALNGRNLEVIGPFDSEDKMEETFADIFHIVDPGYRDPAYRSWRNFTFTEPSVPPPKVSHHVIGKPAPAQSSDDDVDQSPYVELVNGQRLPRETFRMLERAITRSQESGEEENGTLTIGPGLIEYSVPERPVHQTEDRAGRTNKPPSSCVIV